MKSLLHQQNETAAAARDEISKKLLTQADARSSLERALRENLNVVTTDTHQQLVNMRDAVNDMVQVSPSFLIMHFGLISFLIGVVAATNC